MSENSIEILCIFLVVVLFAGTPDLMDGIIEWLSK